MKLTHLFLLLTLTFPAIAERAVVKRVVDGDTLVLEDSRKVRLIGVDTPEVHKSNKLRKDSERTGQDIRIIQELGYGFEISSRQQAARKREPGSVRKPIQDNYDPKPEN